MEVGIIDGMDVTVGDYKFNIEARPSLGCPDVESAYLTLVSPGGVTDRTENVEEYFVFGDKDGVVNGRSFMLGTYTIVADFYSENNLAGDLVVQGTPTEFDVVSGPTQAPSSEPTFSQAPSSAPTSPTAAPSSSPTGDCSIEFYLWDADEDVFQTPVSLLPTHCASELDEFNIEARPSSGCSQVRSAYLNLFGEINRDRTENVIPYLVFGDKNNNVNGKNFDVGSYTIEATLYSEKRGNGVEVATDSFDFEVDGAC